MKICLEELDHQRKALKAIDDAFYGLDETSTDPNAHYIYANPLIKGREQDNCNIDIKMETGTGKTYVGVRAMYDLHQKYGLFKFIVVVPSPAIKEGWKNFIEADYAKQHFSQYYENARINLSVINAGDFNSKKGLLPAHLVEFIEGDRLNSSTIQVLLINAGMLNSKNMTEKNYMQTLLSGWTNPIKGLQATKPVVLIDEPHRFPRDKANYKAIEKLNAQLIIRLGATFPDVGTGKNIKKDYYRGEPQFNLNAVSAFNNGLVKGIDIYYPNVKEADAQDKLTVDSFGKKKVDMKRQSKTYTYNVGDALDVDGNITYKGDRTLSNGLKLAKGMTLLPATMSNSYQEMIIRDAIDKHFEAEIRHFMRDNDHQAKVKTLSLFFIDSIKSYRDKDGWLKLVFEKLLRQKVEALIKEYDKKTLPREKEYLSFLRATLAELSDKVHAGYFGEDRGTGDEAIQAEVDDILKNKEKLLSFKNDKGEWETRRFLFSKWTLREGWDNPNVFVIAKLRTSGSENSKIQEVGRGLRLPVDETGRRLMQDELPSRLQFLIGYDEKEFAQTLISEVNADVEMTFDDSQLTEELMTRILDKYPEYDKNSLLETLDDEQIINRSNAFKEGGFEKLKDLFPLVFENNTLRKDRICENQPRFKEYIKLNKNNWKKMQELWQTFAKRYMLEFDRLNDNDLQVLIKETMQNEQNFVFQYATLTHDEVYSDEETGLSEIRKQTVDYDEKKAYEGMVYGDFLIKLARATKLKPAQLHKELIVVLKEKHEGNTKYLNEITLNNLIRDFRQAFEENYAQRYHYLPLDFQATTSVFDTRLDDFKDEILARTIGINEDSSVFDDGRHLYELPPLRYDSETTEKALLKHGYNSKVVVFGKLPKRAIKIPKYMGGTTTPDFVYIIESNDKKELYLLVETKAQGSGKRISDKQIVAIQQEFFSQLKEHNITYLIAETEQDVYSELEKLEH
ncbi:type III restriction-modification system endonuclease [Streptococcus sciuri]|uniref:Type III restriction-modification system endonuclease n=1 Tax=Streptococcus sciuri TaxID=2973939 RepID=A0ABT2F7V8_9STRE|nr:type III restriction-modification system endonuclease [Streptococcus sciuri]MCS4488494.1 type III restriction-modification system endonuclease [Streptococcus sciuri]